MELFDPDTPLSPPPRSLLPHPLITLSISSLLQPPDYPLSPFKMKFDPPLLHPNSNAFIFFHFSPLARGANVRPPIFPSVYRPPVRPTVRAVYPDGNVCISILHTPGEDPMMYEQASERWSPVQSVEKVLLSVISMLAGTSRFHFSKRG